MGVGTRLWARPAGTSTCRPGRPRFPVPHSVYFAGCHFGNLAGYRRYHRWRRLDRPAETGDAVLVNEHARTTAAPSRWLVLAVVLAGATMAVIAVTIVDVARPSIRARPATRVGPVGP